MEDYLKSIYAIQETEPGAVRTSDVADRIGVTQPTVSSMFSKLDDEGLINRRKNRPVSLTDKGEEVTLAVIRRHRLVETFLVECMGYGWEEVHDEADRLEHHLTDRFTNELADFLGHPEADPHGDPIPGPGLSYPGYEGDRLTEVEEGQTVVVDRIRFEEELLRYLAERSVEPGKAVTVTRIGPYGAVELCVKPEGDGEVSSVPRSIARNVFVRGAE